MGATPDISAEAKTVAKDVVTEMNRSMKDGGPAVVQTLFDAVVCNDPAAKEEVRDSGVDLNALIHPRTVNGILVPVPPLSDILTEAQKLIGQPTECAKPAPAPSTPVPPNTEKIQRG